MQLFKGEILEALLDEGAPVNKVSGSIRSEGHVVLTEEKETNYWKVFIKKS